MITLRYAFKINIDVICLY